MPNEQTTTTQFTARRSVTTYVQTIHAAPERVFPLLCPIREAEWLDGWSARVVHAESGLAEEDGVFATDHAGEEDPTIWIVTKRDESTGEIEMVYFAPRLQVVHLTLRVARDGEAQSKVHVRYVRTALSEEGNRAVAESTTPTRFGESMKHWEAAMNHYLATGRRLAR